MLLYLRHGVELLSTVQFIVWAASIAAEIALLFRLTREGLLSRYPFFVAFLAADTASNIILAQIDIHSALYVQVFRYGTSTLFVFRLAVCGELYERICEHFPGIGKFRLVMAAGLILLAASVTVLTYSPHLVSGWGFPFRALVLIQRFQSEMFAAGLVFVWLLLRVVLTIRHPFRPNVLAHWTITTAYFGVSGVVAALILIIGRGKWVLPLNIALLLTQLGCFIGWLRHMRKSGEEMPAFPRVSPDQVEAIEAYNRELIDAVKSLPAQISARQAEN